MASEKQVAANRRNAAKSTGPKSSGGKQVARMNALKHGLQAEHVVIPGEDPDEFEALLRRLEDHYQPVGVIEDLLVERVAQCTWRLQRLGLIETAVMREEHFSLEKSRAGTEMKRIENAYNYGWGSCELEQPDADDESEPEDYAEALRGWEKAQRARTKAERELRSSVCSLAVSFQRATKALEMLSRYETTIERRLRNATQDLERLQSARKAEAAATATVINVSDLNREES